MKSFIDLSDDFLILDTHVAKVLGINKNVRKKYLVREKLFKNLIVVSSKITQALEEEVFRNVTMIQ